MSRLHLSAECRLNCSLAQNKQMCNPLPPEYMKGQPIGIQTACKVGLYSWTPNCLRMPNAPGSSWQIDHTGPLILSSSHPVQRASLNLDSSWHFPCVWASHPWAFHRLGPYYPSSFRPIFVYFSGFLSPLYLIIFLSCGPITGYTMYSSWSHYFQAAGVTDCFNRQLKNRLKRLMEG